MKSPFPGMDPYIEAAGLWEDFHHLLIGDIHRLLARAVPANYVVRAQRRAYVVLAETEGKAEKLMQADVTISSREAGSRKPVRQDTLAVAESQVETDPLTMRAFIPADYQESFIEIYQLQPEQQPQRQLVTCIEVLSPANKRKGTRGWKQYLRKRQGLLLGEANLVEIDLLRGGTRMPMLDDWPNSPYTLLVAWADRAPACKVWRGHYQEPLPAIPIPLAPPDADISLDLQPMIDAIYAQSVYADDIDYTCPLKPPLDEQASAWLAQRLQQRTPQPGPSGG